MSSLDRIRLTCALTVASRIPRSRPASALELPWAMATRTERSRSLSTDSRCSAHLRPSAEPAGAGSAKRSNIRLVMLGASMALPSWTVRTAEIRSRGGVSLSKKPTAPARSAACTYSSRSKVVSRTTRGASGNAVSRLAAVIPSVPGMRMSSRITSGDSSSASRTASSPSSPSPTTSMSGAASRIMRNPDLTRVSSSIRSVRITGGFLVFRGRCLFLDGHHSAHAPPTVGACPDGELSPDKSKAFSESGQPETAVGWGLGRGGWRAVGHLDLDPVGPVVQTYGHRCSVRVFGHVGQSFLDNTEDGALHTRRQEDLVTGLLVEDLHPHAAPFLQQSIQVGEYWLRRGGCGHRALVTQYTEDAAQFGKGLTPGGANHPSGLHGVFVGGGDLQPARVQHHE